MTTQPTVIEKLKELEKSANDGPWFKEPTPKTEDGWPTCSFIAGTDRICPIYACPDGGTFPSANRRLIIEMRNLLPRLIETLEWVEAELLKANGNFEAYCNRHETIETPCNINVEAAMQTQWLLTNLLQKLEGEK